jgi:protein prenyltransferase alpha subunit repeat containing protein 1
LRKARASSFKNWLTGKVRAQGYEAREAFFHLNVNQPQRLQHRCRCKLLHITMSRALDPETAASLKSGNSETVYNDIVNALSTASDSLLDIEFLGKSHPLPPDCNVLVDGNSIAVTKAKLVQAFVVARKIFFEYVRDCPEDKSLDLKNATAVMLLMDPEHLTAANTRKRLIQKSQRGPKADIEAILREELQFVNGYLTSRLHRHTKSPTLWGHRRWILEIGRSIQMEYDIQQDLTSIVLVSAERHPRNYYAWSHLRWLVQTFTMCSTKTFDKWVAVVKDWCLRHPADTSGFSFLLFCLSMPGSSEDVSRTRLKSSICSEVIRLAVSFRWTHESIWVFLRTLVASEGTSEDEKIAFFEAIRDIQKVQPYGHRFLKTAQG